MGAGVLRFGIFLQIVSVVLAIVSFVLPWYQMQVHGGLVGNFEQGSSQVSLKLNHYSCGVKNSVTSLLDDSGTFEYSDEAGIECIPILTPTVSYTNLGNSFKVCIVFLVAGLVLHFLTMIFQCIMSCQNNCRNCGLKVITFIMSLGPVVCLSISSLSLLAITKSFNIQSDIGSTSSDAIDLNACKLYWCDSFSGSVSDTSFFANGSASWGPTTGWFLVVASAIVSLLASLITLCTPRYKKHLHNQTSDVYYTHQHAEPNGRHVYTQMVN